MNDKDSKIAKRVNNLGFGDNKVVAPKNMEEMINLLAQIMAHSINNTIDLENARTALNASTRIIEAQQADTRMKALAIAANRDITSAGGWPTIDNRPKQLPPQAAA